MTNNFELSALDIARLYKYRWSVELFFKWIKQHLKIKAFWGYTENAVRIQVYTAIIAYTTVALLKEQFKISYTAAAFDKPFNGKVFLYLNKNNKDRYLLRRLTAPWVG